MLLLIAGVLGLCSLAPLFANRNMEVLLTSSALLLVAGLIGSYGLYRLGWRVHWLGFAFSLFFTAVFPLGGIVFYYYPESLNHLLSTDPESLSLGMAVAGVGWLCFLWGYLLHNYLFGRGTRARLGSHERTYSWTALAVFGILGLPFRFFVQSYAHSVAGVALAYLGAIPPILGNLGIICSCALWMAPKRGYKITCLVLVASYAGAGLLSAQRATAFQPLIAFSIFYLLSARRSCQPGRSRPSSRFSIRAAVLVLGIIAVIIVSFPVLTRLKTIMMKERGHTAGAARLEAVKVAWRQTREERQSGSVTQGDRESGPLLQFHRRVSQLQGNAFVVTTASQEWGMLNGRSLLEGVYVFIPRIVWRDKPTIGLGTAVYQLACGKGSYGAGMVPVSGDWYLNFRMMGVVLGMLATGWFYSIVDSRLSGSNPVAIALVAFITFYLMGPGSGISGIISTVLLHGVPIYLLLLLVSKRRKLAGYGQAQWLTWRSAAVAGASLSRPGHLAG